MILRGTDYFVQTASPSPAAAHVVARDRGAVLSVVAVGGPRAAAMDVLSGQDADLDHRNSGDP
jgi:hypothetical protein